RPAAVPAGRPRRGGGHVIDQKASELGRLLGQSEEYKVLLRASERMKEDATCRQLLAEVERIAQDIERATQEGREPAKDQVEKYDRALQSVQANSVYQQVVAARKVALKFPHEMSPVAELFLFLAARADLVQRVIRPALEAGQVVVADRFDLSTIAYQVAGGGLPAEDVAHAIRLATGGLVPDVTLVLDVPVEVGRARQRAARKVQDRFERQDDAFHRRVLEAYRRAAGPGVVHVD